MKVELADLETIEEIDESFRQHLFAQWIMNNEPRFGELKTKLHSFIKKPHIKSAPVILDPSKFDEVNRTIGNLITDIRVNKTHEIYVVVPEALRLALFERWEEKGYSFARMLYYYGNEWKIFLSHLQLM